jgi:hypothetical protein
MIKSQESMRNKTRVVTKPSIHPRGIEVIYHADDIQAMGFLDRFKKKNEPQSTETQQKESSQPPATGKRVKKYTSEGKPVYE